MIYETFVSDQFQRMNDRVLINAAAEFDRHSHVTPINITGSEASPPNMERRNTGKKINFSESSVPPAGPRRSHLPFSNPKKCSTVTRVRVRALLNLHSCSVAGFASGVIRYSVN